MWVGQSRQTTGVNGRYTGGHHWDRPRRQHCQRPATTTGLLTPPIHRCLTHGVVEPQSAFPPRTLLPIFNWFLAVLADMNATYTSA